MRINEGAADREGIWFQQGNFTDRTNRKTEEIISEKNRMVEEDKTLNEKRDFRALCKKFPNISFVVIDEVGQLQSEYRGICNTSAFGDFGQVSIEVDIEVIENLDSDWDNIINMVQAISDHYGEIVGYAKASSNCGYTAVILHYAPAGDLLGVGNLSFMQALWFEPPTAIREYGNDVELVDDLDTKDKYLQAVLMKIQKDIFDKLFEIGEDKQEHKMKPAWKAVEEYQEHFVYEGESFH